MIVAIPACGGGNNKTPTAPTYPSGKPTGVSVKAGSQSVTITWNAVSGAVGYFVYISTDGMSFKKVKGQIVTTTSFQVIDLTNGQIYYFGVSAVGQGGWETAIAYPGGSPTSIPVKPSPPGGPQNPEVGVPPAAPQDLQGTPLDGGADLKWDSNTENDFAFYRIYRRHLSTGSFILIKDDVTAISYKDTDLTNNDVYAYYITAVDTEDLESDRSNTVSLTPENFPPEPLHNVGITVNTGRIVLEWDIPSESDIASYAIERVEGVDPTTGAEIVGRFVIAKPTHGPDSPDQYPSADVPLITVYVDVVNGTTVVIDKSVTVGVKYTYRISAIDLSGQEGPPVQIIAPIPVP
jgi:fibronectin type 3 domain-containing protein